MISEFEFVLIIRCWGQNIVDSDLNDVLVRFWFEVLFIL